MLFHGVHKIIYGVGGIKNLLVSSGFMEFFAYGVFVGEIVAPILILLGAFTRVAAFVVAFNMLVAMLLAYSGSLFLLNEHGAPAIETPFLYFVLAITVSVLGGGKYALNNR